MKAKGADSWAENRTSREDGANEIKKADAGGETEFLLQIQLRCRVD